jgi:hypothetical protein
MQSRSRRLSSRGTQGNQPRSRTSSNLSKITFFAHFLLLDGAQHMKTPAVPRYTVSASVLPVLIDNLFSQLKFLSIIGPMHRYEKSCRPKR